MQTDLTDTLQFVAALVSAVTDHACEAEWFGQESSYVRVKVLGPMDRRQRAAVLGQLPMELDGLMVLESLAI